MPRSTLLAKYADRAGWDLDFQLALCLEYIENQQDDAGFEDFLQHQIAIEEGT
jgi:hypothetical protein